MQSHKDLSNDSKNSERNEDTDKSRDDYGGFLVLRMKENEKILIGDSLIIIDSINQHSVKIHIKAKKNMNIDRLP